MLKKQQQDRCVYASSGAHSLNIIRTEKPVMLTWRTPNKSELKIFTNLIIGYEINQNSFLTSVAGCELCKQRSHS
jgi:hypothetical protein